MGQGCHTLRSISDPVLHKTLDTWTDDIQQLMGSAEIPVWREMAVKRHAIECRSVV